MPGLDALISLSRGRVKSAAGPAGGMFRNFLRMPTGAELGRTLGYGALGGVPMAAGIAGGLGFSMRGNSQQARQDAMSPSRPAAGNLLDLLRTEGPTAPPTSSSPGASNRSGAAPAPAPGAESGRPPALRTRPSPTQPEPPIPTAPATPPASPGGFPTDLPGKEPHPMDLPTDASPGLKPSGGMLSGAMPWLVGGGVGLAGLAAWYAHRQRQEARRRRLRRYGLDEEE